MAAATDGKCGAKTRSGGTCKRSAGWGTDHLGFGNCKWHGGATPNGKKHAARQQAISLAAQLAGEIDIEPHDALLNALARAAAIVQVYARKVAELQDAELAVEHYKERHDDGGGYIERSSATQLHVWVRAYEEAVDRQARLAKTALDAGVDERRVRIVEQLGEQLAAFVHALEQRLQPHLDEAGRRAFRTAVRAELVAIDGGGAG